MTTQEMLSGFRRAITDYKLIKDGDKIAIGLSGGKDSLTLVKLFSAYKKFSPEKFDVIAITVDLCFGKKEGDFSKLKKFCEDEGVPFIVEKTDIAIDDPALEKALDKHYRDRLNEEIELSQNRTKRATSQKHF